MSTIWIIHRQDHQRAALARIAGSADNTVLLGPEDRFYESAVPPDVVVLSLSDDFERELEFAHRLGARMTDSTWIILAPSRDLAEARRVFDTLDAEFLSSPPDPSTLREHIAAAAHRRNAAPLSRRQSRDLLTRRFSRWFADIVMPDLMRALDPRFSRVPLLVFGEPGTGRGLLAHYVSAHGASSHQAFVHIACRSVRDPEALLAQFQPAAAAATVWLEDVDHLPVPLQRRLRDWVEYGLPVGAVRVQSLRWIASAQEPGAGEDAWRPRLDPALAQSLAGILIRIPPLRARADSIVGLVETVTADWAESTSRAPRHFSPEALRVLREHPWPGNHAELEATVRSVLSTTSADPVLAAQLRFEGAAPRLSLEPDPEPSPAQYPQGGGVREEDLPEAEVLPELEPERTTEPGAVPPPEGDPDPIPGPIAGPIADASPVENAFAEVENLGLPLPTLEREAEAAPGEGTDWPRLVRAATHEIRNPLVSIRTFSELLPQRYGDEDFRERFAEHVGDGVRRIDDVMERLDHLVEVPEAHLEAVDFAELLDTLLDQHREPIRRRRLLVLKELDREQPLALVDVTQMRAALGGLLTRALGLVPDGGDVYVASRHHPAGLRGLPMLRVLLRYAHPPLSPGTPPGAVAEEMVLDEASLEVVVAERLVAAHGGSLTLDGSDARDTVIVMDLPAPTE